MKIWAMAGAVLVGAVLAATVAMGALAPGASAQGADTRQEGVAAPVIGPATQVYTLDMPGISTHGGYPDRAENDGVTGYGTVECHIDDHYVTDKCVVIEEKPEGHGFGKAVAFGFLGKKANPAVVKPDIWLKLTVHFGLE